MSSSLDEFSGFLSSVSLWAYDPSTKQELVFTTSDAWTTWVITPMTTGTTRPVHARLAVSRGLLFVPIDSKEAVHYLADHAPFKLVPHTWRDGRHCVHRLMCLGYYWQLPLFRTAVDEEKERGVVL